MMMDGGLMVVTMHGEAADDDGGDVGRCRGRDVGGVCEDCISTSIGSSVFFSFLNLSLNAP